jgi:chromate transporter
MIKRIKESAYVELFVAFFKIGLFTIGGGYAMLPMLRKEVVEKHKWASDDEMLDYFAIGQSTPGIIEKAFAGIRVVVVALILNAVIRMGKKSIKNWYSIAIFLVAFVLVGFISVSAIYIILAAGVLGIVINSFKEGAKSNG